MAYQRPLTFEQIERLPAEALALELLQRLSEAQLMRRERLRPPGG